MSQNKESVRFFFLFFFLNFIHYFYVFCFVSFWFVLWVFFCFVPVSPLVCVLAVTFWDASQDKRWEKRERDRQTRQTRQTDRERGYISEDFFRLPSFTALACLLLDDVRCCFLVSYSIMYGGRVVFLTRSRKYSENSDRPGSRHPMLSYLVNKKKSGTTVVLCIRWYVPRLLVHR